MSRAAQDQAAALAASEALQAQVKRESAKHTPGPWTIKQSHGGRWFLIVAGGGQESAQAYGLKNALLVAAAPDLLEALTYLRDCIETGRDPGMGIVHAAIRKAEGKS